MFVGRLLQRLCGFCLAWRIGFAILLGGLLSGCVSTLLPSFEDTSEALAKASMLGQPKVAGSPIEVYTRIARAANKCWFSKRRPLLKGYIFHARTASDRSQAMITLHEATKKGQRGLKAFIIFLTGAGEGYTTFSVTNQRVPKPLGQRLEEDVRRWANGFDVCKAG